MKAAQLISFFTLATVACAAAPDESHPTEAGESAFSLETCTWSFQYPNKYHWVEPKGGASGDCYPELSSVYMKCRDDANATCAKRAVSSSPIGAPVWDCTFSPYYSEHFDAKALNVEEANGLALARCQSAGRTECTASCYCPRASGCFSPDMFACTISGHGAKRTVRHDNVVIYTESDAQRATRDVCPLGCDDVTCSRVK